MAGGKIELTQGHIKVLQQLLRSSAAGHDEIPVAVLHNVSGYSMQTIREAMALMRDLGGASLAEGTVYLEDHMVIAECLDANGFPVPETTLIQLDQITYQPELMSDDQILRFLQEQGSIPGTLL